MTSPLPLCDEADQLLKAAGDPEWFLSADNEPDRLSTVTNPPAYVGPRDPPFVLGSDAAGRRYLPGPAAMALIAAAPRLLRELSAAVRALVAENDRLRARTVAPPQDTP